MFSHVLLSFFFPKTFLKTTLHVLQYNVYVDDLSGWHVSFSPMGLTVNIFLSHLFLFSLLSDFVAFVPFSSKRP